MNDSYCQSSTTWRDLGQLRISFTTQYENCPPIKLKQAVHFTACSHSGPIALAQATKSTSTWILSIRTCSGRILKDRLEVPDAFSVDWTRGHCLLVLSRRGIATVYSALGEHISEIYFSPNIKEVCSSRLFTTTRDSGIAIMDDEQRIFVVNTVTEPVVWTMNSPVKDAPSAWIVFQPRSQLTHLLLIVGSQFYMGVQGEQLTYQTKATNWADGSAEYTQVAVNNDSDRLALLTSTGTIQIISSDLELIFISLKLDKPPTTCLNFGFLAPDALFIHKSFTKLLIVDLTSQDDVANILEKQSKHARIGVECDGIRVFEDDRVEFLSVATSQEKAVLGVASAADGALLHEAANWLDTSLSSQSFEYASQVIDMAQAIDDCISVAACAWQTKLQKSLLKSARFGMAFKSVNTSKLMKTVRTLRVLNNIRLSRTGIPMSYAQLNELGEASLISRLIDVNAFGTAVKAAEWLDGDSSESVDTSLLEWVKRAIHKTMKSERKYDKHALEEVEEKISNKLLLFPHVSISDAARRAIDAKLPQLARLFIKRETDDSNHVAVLLQLEDVPGALERAAKAQNPQLIHQVVRHLMSSQRRADYELAIKKIPLAQCLYQDLVRQESESRTTSSRQILALLEQASDFERQTIFHLDTTRIERDPSEIVNAYKRAKDAAKNMGDKNIEEVISEVASMAPQQLENSFVSVREMVIEHADNPQRVATLKSQAKLTDKQVHLWTIEGLAKKNKMERLFDMAQKKSPVGYAPFVKACVKYNRKDEIRKYMAKVNGFNDLIAANLAISNYAEAARIAYERRDRDTLHSIQLKAHQNKEQLEKVHQLLRNL